MRTFRRNDGHTHADTTGPKRNRGLLLLSILAGVLLIALILADGGDGSGEVVTGVVVSVDGDLEGVDTFVLLTGDGSRLVVAPAAGVLFDGTAPLSHLRDHLRTGQPVEVELGSPVGDARRAVAIGDARRG